MGNMLFALFVFWVVMCYTEMYWLPWNGRPGGSVLGMARQAASTLGGATYVRMLMTTTIIDLKRKLERCTYYSFPLEIFADLLRECYMRRWDTVEIRNHTLKSSTIGRKKEHNIHGLVIE